MLWKRLRNGSSCSSSSSSVPATDAQSSPAVSLCAAPIPTSVNQVRSSQSSQSTQQSGEDLHELLAFHKSIVQSLGEDLQNRCADLDKVKYLSLTRESQIDKQQLEIDYLSSQMTDYKHMIAELETQLRDGKTRIDELVKNVNGLRNFNTQSQTSDQMVPLDGIVKDALIEQLESDVQRLTQQAFDHDRDMQALVTSHEHKVGEIHTHMESLHSELKHTWDLDHGCEMQALDYAHEHKVNELYAHMDRLRSELKHERSVVAKYARDLAWMTKMQASEDEFQQRIVREAMNEQGRSGGAATRDEKFAQALSYTKELSKSGRLLQDGKEVELHHLQTLCGLAQAQAADIARLRATNANLVATNTKLQDKEGSVVQAKPLGADAFAPSHRRNVTWDLPLRNNGAPTPVESHVLSKLRRRFAIQLPSPRRDTAPRTAPLFSTTRKRSRRVPQHLNLKDTAVLQREFAVIHARLVSSTGDVDEVLGMTNERIAQMTDGVLQRYTAVRHVDLGGPKGEMTKLTFWADGELHRIDLDKERLRSAEHVQVESYLFGDIPM
ncbi:hypothetical protein PMIN07_012161, partial [Paraphaeosphaeria minitans]